MKVTSIFDQESFFDKYAQMERSKEGLKEAGEWHALKTLLPPLKHKDILDLGCGYGHHLDFFLEKEARWVHGIDASERMLEVTRATYHDKRIKLEHCAIEAFAYPIQRYDLVFSSLALHYIEDYETVVKRVFRTLRDRGEFVFSVEHPVYTAQGAQKWHEQDGVVMHWPVDRYFDEGWRESLFLDEAIPKYHRTLESYINVLLREGFTLLRLIEPTPSEEKRNQPGFTDELRRPMMLCIKARKETHDIPNRRERA